ncbi:class I SAM-dependent methyltransferase [Planktomarina temperata]|nr:class I SAM-dependent methyltransferase [Planktomarina temperata]
MEKCPFCNITGTTLFVQEKEFYKHDCQSCRSEFFIPRIEASQEHYDHEKPVNRWEFGIISDQVQRLVKERRREINILDFGCGPGHLIELLNKIDRAVVQGAEINEKDKEFCHSKGIPIIPIGEKKYKFDLIIACHVIEHVASIEDFFQMLVSLVEDNGQIFFSLPNPARFERKFYTGSEDFPPNHLNRITKTGLCKLSARNDIQLKAYWTENFKWTGWRLASFIGYNIFGRVNSRVLKKLLARSLAIMLFIPCLLISQLSRQRIGYTHLFLFEKKK